MTPLQSRRSIEQGPKGKARTRGTLMPVRLAASAIAVSSDELWRPNCVRSRRANQADEDEQDEGHVPDGVRRSPGRPFSWSRLQMATTTHTCHGLTAAIFASVRPGGGATAPVAGGGGVVVDSTSASTSPTTSAKSAIEPWIPIHVPATMPYRIRLVLLDRADDADAPRGAQDLDHHAERDQVPVERYHLMTQKPRFATISPWTAPIASVTTSAAMMATDDGKVHVRLDEQGCDDAADRGNVANGQRSCPAAGRRSGPYR